LNHNKFVKISTKRLLHKKNLFHNFYKKIIKFFKIKFNSIKNLRNQIQIIYEEHKLFKNLNLEISFKSISEEKYDSITFKNSYSSYLQTSAYVKAYSKDYYFYEVNASENLIGRLAINKKKYFGINIYIINRMKLEKNFIASNQIPKKYIYLQLIKFLKDELKNGFLIISPLDNIKVYDPILFLLERLFNFKPYETGLIYLDKCIEDIKKSMKPRWRRQIKNGKKLNYQIKISERKEDIHELINLYKREKKYEGINTSILKKWYKNSSQKDSKFIVIKAIKYLNNAEEVNGYLLFCICESTATYLIGFFLNKNVNKYVSNILLWESINYAKKYGCSFFDLGGIDRVKTPGIAHFKLGLNPITHKDSNLCFTWF
tara:strand:- start:1182 stop:2300 length:1119 start_codon:yes stop_codon:yes gene_type:complete